MSTFSIPTLRTDRLILRGFRRGDAADYAAMMGEAAVTRFLGTGETRSADEAWEMMARALGQWALRGYGLFALEYHGRCVGHCGLLHPPAWPGAEVAYALAPGVWGMGLASEAVAAVRGWAAARLGMIDLFSYIRPENAASAAVLRRAGAVLESEGTLLGGPVQVWRHGAPPEAVPWQAGSTMVEIPVLRTERLELRGFTLEDYPGLCALHADAETMRYLGTGKTRDAALTWAQMTMWTGAFALGAGGIFAVQRHGEAGLVGRCGINGWPAWPEPELAYTFARHEWGRGYAREAAAAVRDWAWRALHPHSLVSFVKVGNAASSRVAQALGGRMTGVLTFEGKPTERWEYARP